MDNLHLKRKMPRQLTVYIFKVQYRQHAVSLVESEKMHRARKRSLEEENGRERESVCMCVCVRGRDTRLIFQNGPYDEPFRGP
jgi:hypothetical protein